jgi:hypothetical protein
MSRASSHKSAYAAKGVTLATSGCVHNRTRELFLRGSETSGKSWGTFWTPRYEINLGDPQGRQLVLPICMQTHEQLSLEPRHPSAT